MKKAKSETSKSDAVFSGNFTETITAVQKALAEAISFDMLGPEEVVAIKSSLSELGSGNLQVLPFGVTRAFEEFLICGLEMAEEAEPSKLRQTEIAQPADLRKIDRHEISVDREKAFGEVVEVLAELEPGKTEASLGPFEEVTWSIAMPDSFTKSIKGLDKKLKGRILEALGKIAQDPVKEIGDTVKPLSRDKKGLWRYRIGDYRLIYRPEMEANRIILLTCGGRGSVYD